MGNPIGARKNSKFKAVSTAPSFNKTPVGNSTPPLPYPTVADLSNSVSAVKSVRFNGDPAYVLNQTKQPSCKGDNAGVCKGVKSGTLNGEVKPVKGSSTVRAGGKPVVRQGDPCTMNGGNNPGVYVTAPAPGCSLSGGKPTGNTDPPIKPQTKEEENWLWKWTKETWNSFGDAIGDPIEGVKGAAKNLLNIPSEFGETALKSIVTQSSMELRDNAIGLRLLGNEKTALGLENQADKMLANANTIDVPKFKMNNPAQVGGNNAMTGAMLLAGTSGIARTGLRTITTAGKVVAVGGEAANTARGATVATEAIRGEQAAAQGIRSAEAAGGTGRMYRPAQNTGPMARTGRAGGASAGAPSNASRTRATAAQSDHVARGTTAEAAIGERSAARMNSAEGTGSRQNTAGETPPQQQAAQNAAAPGQGGAAGSGVTIRQRVQRLRERYLGRTPGKKSKTGREVIERMRREGKIRERGGVTQFKSSNGTWYNLEHADMAHRTDAVTWWNRTGRQYGAKSPEVRRWMLDSNNYTLEHYSINRSLGPRIGETYLPPLR